MQMRLMGQYNEKWPIRRLMGQYNEKWPISLVFVSKPLITVIGAIYEPAHVVLSL